MAGSLDFIGARGRNRTGTPCEARDFKSLVSTNFTTRAIYLKIALRAKRQLISGAYFNLCDGFLLLKIRCC